jgi:hypothetical protein
MRLGLLDAAAASFAKGRKLRRGSAPDDGSNAAALKDHLKYAKTINHDTSEMYAEFRTGGSIKYEDTGEGVGERAVKLAEAGKLKQALPLFEAAVAGAPRNAQAVENLGVTQMRLGLLVAAKESLNTVSWWSNGRTVMRAFSRSFFGTGLSISIIEMASVCVGGGSCTRLVSSRHATVYFLAHTHTYGGCGSTASVHLLSIRR